MGDTLTTADGEVMPDTVPHCTLQPCLWQYLRLQEEGAANESLTVFPSLQHLNPEVRLVLRLVLLMEKNPY